MHRDRADRIVDSEALLDDAADDDGERAASAVESRYTSDGW